MKKLILLILAAFATAPVRATQATLCNQEWFDNGRKTLNAEEAFASRHLLVKAGTDPATQFLICGAATEPLGVCEDEPASGDDATVALLGSAPGTLAMVASEAIDAGENVYTAAGGKVQDEPAVAGTYYLVGRTLTAGAADGDLLQVAACKPVKVVVIAALTAANGAASGAADLAALKTATEAIGDDLRALGTALATPALVKVLV